jgi:hypothetical protein
MQRLQSSALGSERGIRSQTLLLHTPDPCVSWLVRSSFVQNVATLAIVRTSLIEVRGTCFFVAIVDTVVAIMSLILTALRLFAAIATIIPRFSPGPTTIQFTRDPFRIGMELQCGQHGVCACCAPATSCAVSTGHLTNDCGPTVTYYVAVLALWRLQKCSCVLGIVQTRQIEESDTIEPSILGDHPRRTRRQA